MHRGYEKLTEVRTYPQVTTLVNRIDWLGSFANEVPFILAAEKLMEIEAPPRAQYIRTILFELSRIANISLFLGDLGVQMGAVTPVFYGFRDREHVLNLIEAVTGGRFHPNFDRIGGLKDDLPKGFLDECRQVMKRVRRYCDEIEDLLIGNEIFQARTRGVGIIPREIALEYGLSGANLRASGVDWDLRRDQVLPMVWDQADWKVWTHPDGDSFARCWVRLQETRESTKIVDQLLDKLPSGPIMAKVPRIIKVPPGRGVGVDREPARRDGLLRRLQGRPRPVPGQDPLGQLQQHLRRAVGAAGRVRARHHHHPGQPLLHPRGHRSMISVLGVEIPYWGQSLLRVLGGIVAVLLPAGTIVYIFLFKMMSFMQSRLGPMEAGPYGSLQLVAEVGKWLQKEDTAPAAADHRIFKMAPLIVLVSTFLLVAAVPFGPDAWLTNFEVGVFYALAVSSISVLGILIAGWASANKYSLLGGLRAAGQLIAYELPLVLGTLGVVIQAGSMNMQDIVVVQNEGAIFGWDGLGNPFILTQFIGFFVFMVAVQAELTQPPFDMPIAESELVSGYMTEYSGFRFLIFFIAEFATVGVFALIASVLFLGGWGVPFAWFGWDGLDEVDDWMNVAGPLILFTKMMALSFIVMWVRFSFPRFREDQLQRFAWKFLIPLALANIVVTAILKVAI